ncbi:DUF805 domain-containing protein [Flavobacterium supellecticarium]|uniref:DUF805 domain-containing protein n=2 Tax=Flavobacterium supellecticarium TaxID=2565924 RepID=A0A4S4A5C7_9FLAO|nr:DUF805 domain-containing protein [Flavobacterium supellecticarium]
MLDWWKKVMIDNYATFSGRARRSEYWYFMLFHIVIMFSLWMGLFIAIGIGSWEIGMLSVALLGLYILATFLPSLAVTARRLHDVNKSGWMYLISLIPFGSFVLLYYMVLDGDRGRNDYGEDPKMPVGRSSISQIGRE